jgi:hypothetical protein
VRYTIEVAYCLLVATASVEIRNYYKIFVVRPERKRQLGRPKLRWEENIVRGLTEGGFECVNWVHLT